MEEHDVQNALVGAGRSRLWAERAQLASDSLENLECMINQVGSGS